MSFHESTFTRFVVNHLARLFAMALDAQICPLGLTLGQLPILLELWERDGLIRRTVHP